MKLTKLALFLLLLGGVACRDIPAAQSTRPAAASTITAVPQTAVALATPTHQPTAQPISFPTLTLTPSPTAPPTITPTPSPIPTSDLVPGWLVYENEYFGYHFSYPPEATISATGVTGFPTGELPENMTGSQYLKHLKEIYPDNLCVGVQYQLGFVAFTPSYEAEGRYTDPCGVTGVGDYDIVAITETVTIDQYPYTAHGWQVRERDEAATWHSEFYFLTLGDGLTIHYGSTRGTQAQFLEIKPALLQIVTSFHSPATSLPVLTPTPTPVPGLVAGTAAITIGDWSPDGRYLTYWTHTPADQQANPQFPPGDFYFYDTTRQQSCPGVAYRSGSTSWQRRHLWLANGSILIFGDEEVLSFLPCSDNFEVLTGRFTQPITHVVAHNLERTEFLLTSANGYWLYRPEGQLVRPVPGLTSGFENGASFSPDGRFIALSGDGGNSYLLDTRTAEASQVATWQSLHGLSGLPTPEWLDSEHFLVQASGDQGPLLVSTAGEVQNVGAAFFNQTADPGHVALATHNLENGRFALLIQDTDFEDQQPALQLYYSAAGATQTLPIEQPLDRVDASFSPAGRWLILYDHGRSDGGIYQELWLRPLASVAELSRLFESDQTIHYRIAPDDEKVALKVGNYIRIESLPSADTIQSQGYGPYDVFPYLWSPDSRYLAIIGYLENGAEQALFVLPVANETP